ncbi:SF1B family DNA helicase RecD2 [Sutcliffiella rhizosphaerae]|uniref:ATP-dependent RecD2 DNA helicase n=1 Tax=Sutcliffiella rhizosphaerae TaxID=2880967 RepID=A0ABN8A8K5_9BACI|nr:ATP-dependent RecD-like DNA helicase [Sutcliffiella rhizosphaerae]CAG9619443.1 ATP-dependent RecD-like DNA helicase [Sutcliffiella rhizosphaerae]
MKDQKQQSSLDLFEENEKFIKGSHLVTIFHNESNMYSVVRIRVAETNVAYDEKEAVVTGYFPRIHEDETYIFFGQMKDHPRFGRQFHVEHFRKDIPQTRQGIVQYLSSDLFSGIGRKTAEKIADSLGENAISKILENPSVLDSVPKLAGDKAKLLYDTLMEHQGLEQVMIALSQFGFGPQLSMKIYQVYKDETINTLQKNPYQLVETVEGIGFARADELGSHFGISGNHPDRIRAGCLYMLEQYSMQEGHCYVKEEQLVDEVLRLLNEKQRDLVAAIDISREIMQLTEEGKLKSEDGNVYLLSLYFSEQGVVTNIQKVLEQSQYKEQFPESEFLLALGELEDRLKVQYAPSQKEAIQQALLSPMLLLTGGPGTGKTTVIKGIVELYADLHGCSLDPKDYSKEDPFPIMLAAPTGRAAKRMSESTGLPSLTIHRLLGWNGSEGFQHDGENPITCKLLIVDEMSMVDIWLANQLFKSLPDDIQVVLVGDEDQLPSVGPGQVLKDLLASSVIPTVKLTDIYRQADGSSIIELAHNMKDGLIPSNISVAQKDRSFIQCNQAQILDVVKKVCANAQNKGYSAKDIQVLAPMYRGNAGIDKLNEALQELFNPKNDQRRELSFGTVVYRTGDKVLQLVNQPESNVFNGDIGEVVSIFYAKENTEKQDMVIVSFDGIEVTYTKQDLGQITHAYCCSIHKSQGSEFPIVVLPVVKSYYRMLRRNLLYTAVTRSKRFLILCGEEDALKLGVGRADEQSRQTSLKEKLQQKQPGEPIESQDEEILKEIPFWHDANIGMDNISPYDFMEDT